MNWQTKVTEKADNRCKNLEPTEDYDVLCQSPNVKKTEVKIQDQEWIMSPEEQ